MDVPYGHCHCGCGNRTDIAKVTARRRGHIKGQPLPYLSHHNGRWTATPEQRFWEKVEKRDADECWLWRGHIAKSNGYGRIYIKALNRQIPVHRFAYELLVGPIPEGLVINHICGRRECVNPSHLEAVTQRENLHHGAGTKLPPEKVAEVKTIMLALSAKYGLSPGGLASVATRRS